MFFSKFFNWFLFIINNLYFFIFPSRSYFFFIVNKESNVKWFFLELVKPFFSIKETCEFLRYIQMVKILGEPTHLFGIDITPKCYFLKTRIFIFIFGKFFQDTCEFLYSFCFWSKSKLTFYSYKWFWITIKVPFRETSIYPFLDWSSFKVMYRYWVLSKVLYISFILLCSPFWFLYYNETVKISKVFLPGLLIFLTCLFISLLFFEFLVNKYYKFFLFFISNLPHLFEYILIPLFYFCFAYERCLLLLIVLCSWFSSPLYLYVYFIYFIFKNSFLFAFYLHEEDHKAVDIDRDTFTFLYMRCTRRFISHLIKQKLVHKCEWDYIELTNGLFIDDESGFYFRFSVPVLMFTTRGSKDAFFFTKTHRCFPYKINRSLMLRNKFYSFPYPSVVISYFLNQVPNYPYCKSLPDTDWDSHVF